MKFLTWLNTHKTKLTGLLLVILGSVQANLTMLQSSLNPHTYAMLTIIIGAGVAAIGFWNGRKA